MADITMCRGDMCPKKDMCYRYTAPKNEYRQSYFIVVPMKQDESCDEFWKDERLKIKRNK